MFPNRQKLLFTLILLGLTLPACNFFRDVDEVDLAPVSEPADAGVDMTGGPGDAGFGLDTDVDMPADLGPMLPDAARFGDPAENFCNRFEKPCAENFFCSISFNDPNYSLTCRSFDAAGTATAGTPCSSLLGECQIGVDCVDWNEDGVPDPRDMECSRPCLLATGEGCPGNLFCTHRFPDIPGIGYCVPSCDPYSGGGCQGESQCSIDPGYPQRTLLPDFRCLNHGGADTKEERSPCNPNDVAADGCPDGFVCYEAPAESGVFKCVRPCLSDDECVSSAGDCPEEGFGPWNLRYCGAEL